MTAITIQRDAQTTDAPRFLAKSGSYEAIGRTMGEAIDALPPQIETEDNAATLIVVQSLRPDRFFTAEQQQRLTELMARFNAARDTGTALPDDERAELEQLVDAELIAAGQRAEALFNSGAK